MTYNEILESMQNKYKEESGTNPDDAADIGIRLKVLAGEVYRLLNEIKWLRKQAFPNTATGNELEMHARQRGLERRSSQKAVGVLEFSRVAVLAYDVSVPKGTVCALSGDEFTEYETTESAVLKAGQTQVSVKAQAVFGGTSGNTAAQTINTLVTPPAGIEKVTNHDAFSGGAEAENDNQLRARLDEAYAVISNGTNCEFYRRKALEFDEVYSAQAVARENGPGTVTVYVWGNGSALSAEKIEEVQQKLNYEREINVDVTVKSAKERSFSVFGYIVRKKGTEFSEAAEVVKKAVQRFYETKKLGDSVYRADIGAVFMNSGVVHNYTLAANTVDFDGAIGVIPVLGKTTIMELGQ